MQKIHKSLNRIMPWAIIASEVGHVFCCILPTIFSVLTLLAGIGMLTVVPAFMVTLHEALHRYELPIIASSGALVALAWFIHLKADHMDCHSSGCEHAPCDNRKSRSVVILKIGTILFLVNITIYVFLHALPHAH